MSARDMDCEGGTAAFAGGWLRLAATPVFALMALLTFVLGAAPADALCTSGHGVFSPTGMFPMYVLMSAFHAGPWLKFLSRA